MITYKNQKLIKIRKSLGQNFIQVDRDDWARAFQSLSNAGFGLWLYLASNRDGFEIALSRADALSVLGFSSSSYDRAVKELEEVGYLRHQGGNFYEFSTKYRKEN